eukprot:scaffold2094_cov239-Pinguiococcus_pyrenoidosus.AAC.2
MTSVEKAVMRNNTTASRCMTAVGRDANLPIGTTTTVILRRKTTKPARKENGGKSLLCDRHTRGAAKRLDPTTEAPFVFFFFLIL